MMRRILPALLLPAALAACSPSSTGSPQAKTEALEAASPPGDICAALMAPATATTPVVSTLPTVPALPTIPAVPVTGPVHILAFGDFGNGSAAQARVARAMGEVHGRTPFHFGLTLGDNFYEHGLNSPVHPRWRTDWEEKYGPLGIRIYATLGNHDYHDPASPGAQQARSRLSASWCLPRPFYTFTAGPVQLFAVDTEPIEERLGSVREQLSWLDGALAASRAPWKVVYGHHPVYTNGQHGGTAGVLPPIRDALLPILKKHQVDVYLAGHDHDLEALGPDGGVRFLISGGGGRRVRPLASSRCRDWAESRYGFVALKADEETLTATFFDDLGRSRHRVELREGEKAPDCPRR